MVPAGATATVKTSLSAKPPLSVTVSATAPEVVEPMGGIQLISPVALLTVMPAG